MTERKKTPIRSKRPVINTEVSDGNLPPKSGGSSPSEPPFQPKAEDPAPVKPRQLQPVPLKVWLVASRHKWDQLAGFEARAKAQGFVPMTIPEWEKAYQDFLVSPMK